MSGHPEPRLGSVNLHDWIDELCDVLEIETEVDEALVLDLARDAAHLVERRAARARARRAKKKNEPSHLVSLSWHSSHTDSSF